MKTFFSKACVLCVITCLFAQAVCTAESSSAKTEESNPMMIQMLIDQDLFKNAPMIQEQSKGLSQTQRMMLYTSNQKSAGGPFALNFFLGWGIGSFVQGDKKTGTKILIADGAGTLAMGLGYVLILSSISYSYDSDGYLRTHYGDGYTLGAIMVTAASLVMTGFNIYGWFKPFSYAKSYNQQLANSLNVYSADVSIAPVVSPSGETGLALGFKLAL